MLRELNVTKIVLLQKVKAPKLVFQFRPISLCNFADKVISQVTVDGCGWVSHQSAFMANHQIQDNIIVAQEIFHFLKNEEVW